MKAFPFSIMFSIGFTMLATTVLADTAILENPNDVNNKNFRIVEDEPIGEAIKEEAPEDEVDAKPESDQVKQQQLKQSLGGQMKAIDQIDEKGNDDAMIPWVMGWIKSATGSLIEESA